MVEYRSFKFSTLKCFCVDFTLLSCNKSKLVILPLLS
uniref:Uncharacterized protein n=1 Tax=Siphoviridae sp. ctDOT22 TaxID=2827812 RepID=A0A8S5SX55_9CAUD|nr:MAG TPA: hypothetical protein [Siphoviridae sp. ctDOT22]